MIISILNFVFLSLFFFYGKAQNNAVTNEIKPENKKYEIIQKSYWIPSLMKDSIELGIIDSLTIQQLNEPLKALIAFYAAIGYGTNSNCNQLVTRLGLGKLGSQQQKKIIRKYFPSDSVAEKVIKRNYPSKSTFNDTFSNYTYMTLFVIGDTIKVDYSLFYYQKGLIGSYDGIGGNSIGKDVYLYKENKYLKLQRNIWPYTDN